MGFKRLSRGEVNIVCRKTLSGGIQKGPPTDTIDAEKDRAQPRYASSVEKREKWVV